MNDLLVDFGAFCVSFTLSAIVSNDKFTVISSSVDRTDTEVATVVKNSAVFW